MAAASASAATAAVASSTAVPEDKETKLVNALKDQKIICKTPNNLFLRSFLKESDDAKSITPISREGQVALSYCFPQGPGALGSPLAVLFNDHILVIYSHAIPTKQKDEEQDKAQAGKKGSAKSEGEEDVETVETDRVEVVIPISDAVKDIKISPRGRYLIAYSQLSEANKGDKNLRMYDLTAIYEAVTSSEADEGKKKELLMASLNPVTEFNLPRRDLLPIQWTVDESYYAYANQSSIIAYPAPGSNKSKKPLTDDQQQSEQTASSDEKSASASAATSTSESDVAVASAGASGKKIIRFPIANATFSLSPVLPIAIASFIPVRGSKPCEIAIYSGPLTNSAPQPAKAVASINLFRGTHANYEWSRDGVYALIRTDTDVDVTGKSYYGESSLFLLRRQKDMNMAQPSAVQVSVPKEGGIHAFAFLPTSKLFCVLSGSMPATCTLHNVFNGNIVCELESTLGRNTISFCPFGRFVMLGGFGNLPGNMEFWEVKATTDPNSKKGPPVVKSKLLASTRTKNPAISWGWSPCGRYFLTATLAPRMNVDNGYELRTYKGELVKSGSEKVLLGCQFRPAIPGQAFRSRASSPDARVDGSASSQKGGKSGRDKSDGEGKLVLVGQEGGFMSAGTVLSTKKKVEESKPATTEKKPGVYRPPGSTGALSALIQAERMGSRTSTSSGSSPYGNASSGSSGKSKGKKN